MSDEHVPDTPDSDTSLPQSGVEMPQRTGIIQEFWLFLRENKAYWMIPILLVLLLMGGLLLLAALSPAASPFVYTLF